MGHHAIDLIPFLFPLRWRTARSADHSGRAPQSLRCTLL